MVVVMVVVRPRCHDLLVVVVLLLGLGREAHFEMSVWRRTRAGRWKVGAPDAMQM